MPEKKTYKLKVSKPTLILILSLIVAFELYLLPVIPGPIHLYAPFIAAVINAVVVWVAIEEGVSVPQPPQP